MIDLDKQAQLQENRVSSVSLEKKNQQNSSLINELRTEDSHIVLEKLSRKTPDASHVDWKERIAKAHSKGVERILPLILTAYKYEQMNLTEALPLLLTALNNDCDINRARKEYYLAQIEENPEDIVSRNMVQHYDDIELRFRNAITRFEENPELLQTFFDQAKKTVEQAKEDLLANISAIDVDLQNRFAKYTNAEWKSLNDRIILLLSPDFDETYKKSSGLEKQKYMTIAVGGYVTPAQYNQPRSIVGKIDIKIDVDEQGNLTVKLNKRNAITVLSHEAIHASSDSNMYHEPITLRDGEEGIRETRGFIKSYYDSNGQRVIAPLTEDNTMQRALEEGAVVTIDLMRIHNDDSAKVRDVLNSPLCDLSPELKHAASITIDIVDKLGIEALTSSYMRHDAEGWIRQINEKLGIDVANAYTTQMKSLQQKIEGSIGL